MKTIRLAVGACIAALALSLNGGLANAQLQKAPDTKKAEPAKKAPAKKAAKAKSACAGLDEAACTAKGAECRWIKATKTKAGKSRKAYCRSVPAKKAKTTTPAKKAPAKSAAPPPAQKK